MFSAIPIAIPFTDRFSDPLSVPFRPAVPPLGPLGLRIDVESDEHGFEREFQTLYDRMQRRGDCLHGMPARELQIPGLVLRQREADGEFYVYVEDRRRGRLAGYTVFNRMIELDRRADRCFRAPHSRFAAPYRRRGLASAIYRCALDAGMCLLSGARQSPAAHALWHSLSTRYRHGYVDLGHAGDKTLTYLGDDVDADVLHRLPTRMLLLGHGWTIESLAAAAGMQGLPAATPHPPG